MKRGRYLYIGTDIANYKDLDIKNKQSIIYDPAEMAIAIVRSRLNFCINYR